MPEVRLIDKDKFKDMLLAWRKELSENPNIESDIQLDMIRQFYNSVEDFQTIAAEITAPPKSNADRIRQMTDEELADFLLEVRAICKLCKKRNEICEGAYHECWNGIDDWLKQEVSEDAES